MKQMDDCIGAVIQNLKDLGVYDNTIIVFTTDNGTETFTWPDGGFTPFHDAKGSIYEGGFRAPAIVRWPGVVPPGTVINDIFSGLDWFPTLAIAAGAPEDIVDQLLTGMTHQRHRVQGPPRRLQPDRAPEGHRAVAAAARSGTSPMRCSARCGSTTSSTTS